MGTNERKEKEREIRRDLILNTAQEIISSEGIDNVSIRKIAKKIEYSPAIIYYYFKDKDEIINCLMIKVYKTILSTLNSITSSNKQPKEKLREGIKNYILMALRIPLEYKTIMLSSSQDILKYTSVLFKGAAQKREAIGILCQQLRDIYYNNPKDESYIELTAQVLWSSIFGLIIRIIIEEDLNELQKEILIEHHVNILIKGIIS
jgi:AcrR family transcriptional regulator